MIKTFKNSCFPTLTLLFTIIFSSSLLISANVGLLSGSCFQQRSIRLYLSPATRAKKKIKLLKVDHASAQIMYSTEAEQKHEGHRQVHP